MTQLVSLRTGPQSRLLWWFFFVIACLSINCLLSARTEAQIYVMSGADSGPGSFRQIWSQIDFAFGYHVVINISCVVKEITFTTPTNFSKGNLVPKSGNFASITINGNGVVMKSLVPSDFFLYFSDTKGIPLTINDVTFSGMTVTNSIIHNSSPNNGALLNLNNVSFLNNTGTLVSGDRPFKMVGSTAAHNKNINGSLFETQQSMEFESSTFYGNVANTTISNLNEGITVRIASCTFFKNQLASSSIEVQNLAMVNSIAILTSNGTDISVHNEGTIENSIYGTAAGQLNITNSFAGETYSAGIYDLTDNGGKTQTCRIDSLSVAFNSGSDTTSITTDQRGATRKCGLPDIGAYELITSDCAGGEPSSVKFIACRSFLITSGADSGPGTFREAMEVLKDSQVNGIEIEIACSVKQIAFTTPTNFQASQYNLQTISINGHGVTMTSSVPSEVLFEFGGGNGKQVTINDVTFSGITATNSLMLITSAYANAYIRLNDVSFLYNAGSLVNGNTGLELSRVTVAYNNGVGNLISVVNLKADSSTFYGNTADNVVYSDGSGIFLTSCTFFKNNVTSYSIKTWNLQMSNSIAILSASGTDIRAYNPGTIKNCVYGLRTGPKLNITDSYAGKKYSAGIHDLADNGGKTQTCRIDSSSVAYNHGGTEGLSNTDQRGANRKCGLPDIGAYELITSDCTGGEPPLVSYSQCPSPPSSTPSPSISITPTISLSAAPSISISSTPKPQDRVTFFVTSEADSGPGSFREAVDRSHAIHVSEIVIEIMCNVKQIVFTTPTNFQVINDKLVSVTINGNGVTLTSLVPSEYFLYPMIYHGIHLTVNDVTFSGMTVTNSILYNMSPSGGSPHTLNNVTFLNNTGTLASGNSPLKMFGSTVAFNYNNGSSLFTNYNMQFNSSTFYGNVADTIISNSYKGITIYITSCTFFKNQLTSFAIEAKNLEMVNSIAILTSSGTDIRVYNEGFIKNCVYGLRSGPKLNITDSFAGKKYSAGIYDLADNSGKTQTCRIDSSSVAYNRGVDIAGITTDQRGATRKCGLPDIGAYELITSDCIGGGAPVVLYPNCAAPANTPSPSTF